MMSTRRTLIRFILCVLTACLGIGASARPLTDSVNYDEDPYVLLVGEAEKAIAEEDYPTACQRLLDAIAVDPKRASNVLLQNNLAMVYSYMGEDSIALRKLNDILEREPRMTAALRNRAHVRLKLGDDINAYDDFSAVLQLDSTDVQSRYYHGMMALYGGRNDIAEADFAVMKSLQPNAPDTDIALGTLYSLTGRDLEAIDCLQRVIERTPAPEYYAALAGCQLALDRLDDASTTIAAGLKRYSHDAELYYYRAWLNKARYRLDDARRDADRAIALGASEQRVRALFAR